MSYSVKGTSITLTRGDTFTADIKINKADCERYIPQEGDTIRFAMKKTVRDKKCLIEKDIPIDTMQLVLEPDDTKELDFGNYVYDIQLTKATGEVDTFITASTLTLTEEVE